MTLVTLCSPSTMSGCTSKYPFKSERISSGADRLLSVAPGFSDSKVLWTVCTPRVVTGPLVCQAFAKDHQVRNHLGVGECAQWKSDPREQIGPPLHILSDRLSRWRIKRVSRSKRTAACCITVAPRARPSVTRVL